MKKHHQLTAGERGEFLSRAKQRKGYRMISEDLCSLLIATLNDHPHVIVPPNAKDTIQVKNSVGEKLGVRKILTMVGLGTIFLDIVRDNPAIKKKVGKRAFRYIISTLGCVRQFTNLYKTMCRCTPCVGLQTLHCLFQVKRGVMHRKIAIDMQRQTTKARAEEMARGWGDVTVHPIMLDAIRVGTCTCWSDGDVPHWEYQTLQCGTCTSYSYPMHAGRGGT